MQNLATGKLTSMPDFPQLTWDALCERDCRDLVRLAVREDLEREYDYTTLALVPQGAAGAALVVARQSGVLAGLPAAQIALDECDRQLVWEPIAGDGDVLAAGQFVARITGPARSLLTAERLALNLLCKLSGVASHTRKFVDAVAGTKARIYDTRKTTPGWRRLEKYAVRCGGACSHRLNLASAILIKDNHLAFGADSQGSQFSPAQAVLRAKEFVAGLPPKPDPWIIEVEVESLAQLQEVLPTQPHIVLLDNMTCDQLRQSVALRNQLAPNVELEASGGVSLATVRSIAETGVDRISAGALTHGAVWLDLALDWE